MNHKAAVLKAFQTIPSVGKQVAKDLWDLGYRSLDELAHQNPEKIFAYYNKRMSIAVCSIRSAA